MKTIVRLIKKLDSDSITIILLGMIFLSIHGYRYGFFDSLKLLVDFLYVGGVVVLTTSILSIFFKWESFQERKLRILSSSLVIVLTFVSIYITSKEWLIKLALLGVLIAVVIYGGLFFLTLLHKKK